MRKEGLLAFILIVVVVFGIYWLIGWYRINTGEGAVVTHFGGVRTAETDVGWKHRWWILEWVDIYPTVNDYIYFPGAQTLEGGRGEERGVAGVEINAKDDVVVDVSAMTQFNRNDLVQWGVLNTRPQEMFQKAIDGVIRDVIQTHDSDVILHERDTISEMIFERIRESNIEEQYGVEVVSFQIQHSTYIDEVVKANAHKQALSLEAAGRLAAAIKDAEAIKIKADAESYKGNVLKGFSPEVLEYMANIELYNTLESAERTGDVVWVIQGGVSGMSPAFIPGTPS